MNVMLLFLRFVIFLQFCLLDLNDNSDKKVNEIFKYVMNGPVLVTIGTLGMIGNILSIIIFTRSSMKTSAINTILIGKKKQIKIPIKVF